MQTKFKNVWINFIAVILCFISIFLFQNHFWLATLIILLIFFLLIFFRFENKTPPAKEIALIAIMTALTCMANLMSITIVPFQAGTAMIILSGAAFGGETAFLIGAFARISINFYYGQGAWTPWQMLAWGLLGLISGFFFYKKEIPKKRRLFLGIYGFFSTLFIYGGIMNFSTVILTSGSSSGLQDIFNWPYILSVYAAGIPYDLLHAAGTCAFLLCFGPLLLDVFTRITKKYSLNGNVRRI